MRVVTYGVLLMQALGVPPLCAISRAFSPTNGRGYPSSTPSWQTNLWGTTLKALKIVLLGSSFLFGAVAAANAADVYRKEGGLKDEPYAAYAPITWAGFYLGGHIGVTLTDDVEARYKDYTVFGETIDNALTGGVHVGYNWQTPSNWVYGVEADLDLINDKLEGYDVTDFLASIRGRAGIASGNSLIYATAGLAYLSYNKDFVGGDGADDSAFGFVGGVGYEYKFTNNFSVGLEGLYYNFSSDLGEGLDLDRDFWTVRARATYHFGSRSDEPLK